jgi:hypothetical protein
MLKVMTFKRKAANGSQYVARIAQRDDFAVSFRDGIAEETHSFATLEDAINAVFDFFHLKSAFYKL